MITHQPVSNHDDLSKVIDGILNEVGLDRSELDGKLTFAGLDPIRPTQMKVGAISATIAGANALASALIWKHRTGESQDVHIDLRKAYTIQSAWQDILENCTLINGTPHMFGGNIGAFGLNMLPTKDGRFVMFCPAYHAISVRSMEFFNAPLLPRPLEEAAMKWNSDDLEKAAQDKAIPLVKVLTPEEYAASEQGKVNATAPLITIEKIGDSDPVPLEGGKRPLSGIRALGMVHVVAGPTVLRQLGAQGADCLNLNTLNYVENPAFYWQCDAGMRQTYLDARISSNLKKLYDLVKGADIFVQNLRPGLAAKEGFSAGELARLRPGIVCVDLFLNQPKGPNGHYLGFDFNAGALTGLFTQLGSKDQPRTPRGVNVICDFLTGYLAAIGAQAALLRRAKEGGSYKVTVTLAQTVMFEQSLGLIDEETLLKLDELGDDHKPLAPNLQTGQTAFGEFTRLGSQIEMSKTPEYWEDPIISPIGSSKPEWLPRD